MQIYIKNTKNPDNIHDCQGFELKVGNCLATNAQIIKTNPIRAFVAKTILTTPRAKSSH
jgi:hypothetical protein